ncbi:hypothetical protein ACET3Z_008656 [Daucus carota]
MVSSDDQQRRRILMRLADLIDENKEELAALDTIDAGELFHHGKNRDIPGAAETLHYYAGAADKIHGDTLNISMDYQIYTLLDPVGVVGHIIPWNFPAQMFAMKVAPSLAAGCTMVVKPADQQIPLSALYYAHMMKLVGHLNEPEIQYVALRNINLIVQRRPLILAHEIKRLRALAASGLIPNTLQWRYMTILNMLPHQVLALHMSIDPNHLIRVMHSSSQHQHKEMMFKPIPSRIKML